MRRDIRGNANVPPSVPEEPTSAQLAQFPSMRRDPNYASKLQLPNGGGQSGDWNGGARAGGGHQQQYLGVGEQHQALPPPAFQTAGGQQQNGNSVNPINVHTDLSPHQFR